MAEGLGIVFIFFLLFLVLAILLPFWVYNDAQKNSPQSAVLWALVTFFGGILGFLLYFLIGRDTNQRGSTQY